MVRSVGDAVSKSFLRIRKNLGAYSEIKTVILLIIDSVVGSILTRISTLIMLR